MKIKSILREDIIQDEQNWIKELTGAGATARLVQSKIVASYQTMVIIVEVGKGWIVSDPGTGAYYDGTLTKSSHPVDEVPKIIHAAEKLTTDHDESSAEKQLASEPIIREVMGWLVTTFGGKYQREVAEDSQLFHSHNYGSQPCYVWTKNSRGVVNMINVVGIVLLQDGENVHVWVGTGKASDGEDMLASAVKRYIRQWTPHENH